MAVLMDTSRYSRRPARPTKKHAPGIDMTPMVDLGFLLIAFFITTTELSKPATLLLNMPKQGPPMELGMSNALTILLGKDNAVFYYHGEWRDARTRRGIIPSSFASVSGLRQVIREKQVQLDKIKSSGEGRDGLMLLIKPGRETSYENMIRALDEA